jgi:Uma2 family endonuclease
MAMMVLDIELAERLKAERQTSGGDRFDEVWEGTYMMAPLANNEHQDLQARLAAALQMAFGFDSPARIQPGANVSDREVDRIDNYRCPDVVVVLPNSTARDRVTHWHGGPDFCVEILSAGDRSRDKLDFYATVGVRELLLIDRDPWAIEDYSLRSNRLELVGRIDAADPKQQLNSDVVPVSFRLLPGTPRPRILVAHRDGVQSWTV